MVVPKPPVDTSSRSPNCGGYSSPRQIEAFAVHITDGTNSLGWLCNPVSQASANFLVRRDGWIYELVPPNVSPWTNGDVNRPDLGNPLIAKWVKGGINPNTRCLTVECEGKSTYWAPGALTDQQEDSLVKLLAWGLDSNGVAIDDVHCIRHNQINDVSRHNCPGFSTVEWTSYIARAAQLAGTQSVTPLAVPAVGHAESALIGRGAAVSTINWGGEAASIDGTAYVDIGITVTNAAGKRYSRSLKNGVMGPWVEV